MARPKLHDEELRGRLLDRAAQIVGQAGAAGLSLRMLAAAEATSTSAIYSLFGGKPELLGALFETANASFGDHQRSVAVTRDPLADLLALGRAYRQWALEHPHLYRVVFGGALAGFQPSQQQIELAWTTIDPLQAAVDRAIAAGVLAGPSKLIAMSAWSTVHGLVSLGLDCQVDVSSANGRGMFDELLRAVMRGWTPQ